jgi:hypothetical protein
MPKQFPRGKPDGEMAVVNNLTIRNLFARDKAEMDSMYPAGFELHDLVNGEVELVSGEDVLRCYSQPVEEGYVALIIDDYHPDDDANMMVDDVGNILNPEDDDG